MGKIPELLSDWEDLDSEMRLRRLAAGTQPSLLQRRFFTNLQRVKQEFITAPFQVCVIFYVFWSDQFSEIQPGINMQISLYIFCTFLMV